MLLSRNIDYNQGRTGNEIVILHNESPLSSHRKNGKFARKKSKTSAKGKEGLPILNSQRSVFAKFRQLERVNQNWQNAVHNKVKFPMLTSHQASSNKDQKAPSSKDKVARDNSRMGSSSKSSMLKNYKDNQKYKSRQQRQTERGILKPSTIRDGGKVNLDPRLIEQTDESRLLIKSESSIGVDTEGLMVTAEEIA